jgi:hypothetical protein
MVEPCQLEALAIDGLGHGECFIVDDCRKSSRRAFETAVAKLIYNSILPGDAATNTGAIITIALRPWNLCRRLTKGG